MQGLLHGLIRKAFALGLLVVLAGLAMTIGGCNTIAGVGEDVSAAGQTVADWASPDDTAK